VEVISKKSSTQDTFPKIHNSLTQQGDCLWTDLVDLFEFILSGNELRQAYQINSHLVSNLLETKLIRKR